MYVCMYACMYVHICVCTYLFNLYLQRTNIPKKKGVMWQFRFHRLSLNTSKGVIKSRYLEGESDKEICENLSSQSVGIFVRRTIKGSYEY